MRIMGNIPYDGVMQDLYHQPEDPKPQTVNPETPRHLWA